MTTVALIRLSQYLISFFLLAEEQFWNSLNSLLIFQTMLDICFNFPPFGVRQNKNLYLNSLPDQQISFFLILHALTFSLWHCTKSSNLGSCFLLFFSVSLFIPFPLKYLLANTLVLIFSMSYFQPSLCQEINESLQSSFVIRLSLHSISFF